MKKIVLGIGWPTGDGGGLYLIKTVGVTKTKDGVFFEPMDWDWSKIKKLGKCRIVLESLKKRG